MTIRYTTKEGSNVEIENTPVATQAAEKAGLILNPSQSSISTGPAASDRSGVVGAYEQAREAQVTVENSRGKYQQDAEAYAAGQREQRISAINSVFAPRIRRQEKDNEGNLARVAALNFNKGIVGSGADTTNTDRQKGTNEGALQAIEEQKALAIQQAFSWADELADKKAERAYQTASAGAKANVDIMRERADKAIKSLEIFGKAGHSADDIRRADPNTYNVLRSVSGMSDTAIDTYLKTQAPAGTYQWDQAKVVGKQMYVPKVINGRITMDTVALPFSPNKEAQSVTKTDQGVFVLYKDGTYENINTPQGGGSSSGFTLSPGQTRYDASGKPIAEAPKANSTFTIPNQTRNNLLKTFQPVHVDQIQKDIQQYGLAKVLEGMPDYEKNILNTELNKDYNIYSAGN